jgi:spectrin alpha
LNLGYQLLREANDLADWIRSRETVASQEEIGSDLEQVEVLQKKFDDFKGDLKANEVRLQVLYLNCKFSKLIFHF